jgi:ArsR family transcriptional regulator
MEEVNMDAFVKVMKALSDPNRVRIVKMLQRRMLCVCEMQAVLGLAQPTVSKHLKILEEAGLVSREKDGLWVNYAVSDGSRSPYAASMLGNLRHWLSDDPELKSLLEGISDIDRKVICARETPAA